MIMQVCCDLKFAIAMITNSPKYSIEPSIVVFLKSCQTTKVNLCFLLYWVALVRFITKDGGFSLLGGQGVRIGFST